MQQLIKSSVHCMVSINYRLQFLSLFFFSILLYLVKDGFKLSRVDLKNCNLLLTITFLPWSTDGWNDIKDSFNFLKDGDQIDIVSSKDSVYGYLSIEGGFEIEKTWAMLLNLHDSLWDSRSWERLYASKHLCLNLTNVNDF